ncbi:hypothetical protein I547_3094 [Mycobacterium kansasii 824]|nr:hypothetical protein I547_3094 [Mycobacterium kansasii 824]
MRPASAPSNSKTTDQRAAAVIRDLDQKRAFGAGVPAARRRPTSSPNGSPPLRNSCGSD